MKLDCARTQLGSASSPTSKPISRSACGNRAGVMRSESASSRMVGRIGGRSEQSVRFVVRGFGLYIAGIAIASPRNDAGTSSTMNSARNRVLAIKHSPAHLEAMEAALQAAGHSVRAVAAEDAAVAARDWLPDALLVEVHGDTAIALIEGMTQTV